MSEVPIPQDRPASIVLRLGAGLLALLMLTILWRFVLDLRALQLFCALATPLFVLIGWVRPTFGFYPLLLCLPLLPLVVHLQGEVNFSLVEVLWWSLLTGQSARFALAPRRALHPPPPAWPMLTLFTIALAGSVVVRLLRNALWTDPITWQVLWESLGSFFRLPQESPLHPLRALVVWLEGIAFLRLVRQNAPRGGFQMRVRFALVISLGLVVLTALHQLMQAIVLGDAAPMILADWQLHTDWLPDFLRRLAPGLHAVHGTWPDVNSFASYLLLMLPIVLSTFVLSRDVFARAILMLLGAGTVLVLFFSFSRVAILWMPIAVLFWFMLNRQRCRKLSRWIDGPGRWVLASVLVVGLVGLHLLTVSPVGRSVVSHTVESSAGERLNVMLKGRLHLWEKALLVSAEDPFFGVGQGAFYDRSAYHHRVDFGAPQGMRRMADGTLVWNPESENAHNQFLQIYAETGLIGLGLLLLAMGQWGGIALRFAGWGNGGQRYAARGSLAAVFAITGTLITGHGLLIVELMFLFWVVVGLVFMEHERPTLPDLNRLEPLWSGSAATWAVILLIAIGVRSWNARGAPDLIHSAMGLYPRENELEYHPVTGDLIVGAPFQWTTNEANLLVRRIHPDCSFQLSNLHGAEDPVSVEIWINDELRAIVTPPDEHWWPYRFSVEDLPPGTIYRLSLRVRVAFRPGGGDERLLGIRMRNLSY